MGPDKRTKTNKRVFPKEGEARLKDTIRELKSRNRYLERKAKFYESKALDQVEQAMVKPQRIAPETREEFRRRFLKEFRDGLRSLKGQK